MPFYSVMPYKNGRHLLNQQNRGLCAETEHALLSIVLSSLYVLNGTMCLHLALN